MMLWLGLALHNCCCLLAMVYLVESNHPWWAAIPAISFLFTTGHTEKR
jgi:hypothetical protein